MILEYRQVAVSDGKWMLGTNNKLVWIARMLVIVDDAGNERCELVMSLKTLLNILLLIKIVQGLHWVDNVCHIVEWVFFEIARLNLFGEIDQVF